MKGQIQMNENTNQEYEEISIIEIINILLKGKVIFLALLIIGTVLGTGYGFYQNTKITNVSKSTIELVSSTTAIINTEKHPLVMQSNVVIDEVEEDLNISAVNGVSISVSKLGLFTIAVTNNDAEFANQINSSISENYAEILENDYLQRYEKAKIDIIDSYKYLESSFSEYTVESKQADLTEMISALSSNVEEITVNVLSEPVASTQGGASIPKNTAIGAIVGLFLGFVLVFMKHWWNNNKEQLVVK